MKNFRKISFELLKYTIALAALIWVFYDTHFNLLIKDIGKIGWRWTLLAVFFDIISYICQGIRWKYLLRSIGNISWIKTTQAIYAGLFTNEIFPMRLGELVRAYLVTRWLSKDFVSAVPSMAVERLFDGIWLAIAIGFVSIFVQLPEEMIGAADILGIIVITLTIAFVGILFLKENSLENILKSREIKFRPVRGLINLIVKVLNGVKQIEISRYFYLSLFFSLMILVMQALAFWLVMIAYGINVSFWTGATVLLIVHFGTAIPNAPSNIGTYQFFTVLGLSIFGVDKTTAAGFSLVVFIILTIPLWIIGLLAINKTGLTLRTIKDDINYITKNGKNTWNVAK